MIERKLFEFKHTYQSLPQPFFKKVNPSAVSNPKLVFWNEELAKQLKIDPAALDKEELAELFVGNQLFKDSEPIAQAYAGHQFGNFTMLGDGRAILLGEHVLKNNSVLDIQLKGAGITPFSRGGDGRGTLSSMLRELIMSETLHQLNIPTSRGLAVVSTGDQVYRQTVEMGGILTRVATSHLRVGTFEYARRFLDQNALEQLLDYALERHYPSGLASENRAKALLEFVMDKQIQLIVNWMRVGFIHGVMNTDNFTISGETIDYGPCAFMNAYFPGTVFSSIDRQGRYAYGNQPAIGQWNLSCLAGALLPLFHENEKIAIDMAEQLLNKYPEKFKTEHALMLARKVGFETSNEEIARFVSLFLQFLEKHRIDFTNAFLYLESPTYQSYVQHHEDWEMIKGKWKELLKSNNTNEEQAIAIMQKNNPTIIPRNHNVEKALLEVSKKNEFTFFKSFMAQLKDPYSRSDRPVEFMLPPEGGDAGYKTYCGT